MAKVVVINPNSSEAVTQAISDSLPSFAPKTQLSCHTSHEGPAAIKSHQDFDASIPPLFPLLNRLNPAPDAVVIACFSDPGVAQLATYFKGPVVGIQQAATAQAIKAGQRFGILALVDASIERQRRALAARHETQHWAGSRALNQSPEDFLRPDHDLQHMIDVGRALRDQDGAETLILGCAGMMGCQDALEDALGIPVIEPCRAAVELAVRKLDKKADAHE